MAKSRKKVSLDQLHTRVSNIITLFNIYSSDKKKYYEIEDVVPIDIKYSNYLDGELEIISTIKSEIWDILWDINTCNTKKEIAKRNSKNKEILKVLQA